MKHWCKQHGNNKTSHKHYIFVFQDDRLRDLAQIAKETSDTNSNYWEVIIYYIILQGA